MKFPPLYPLPPIPLPGATRKRPGRSWDPTTQPEPATLARAVLAQRAGDYTTAAELYQYLDQRYPPHWHARMMSALLIYHKSSDPHFAIELTGGAPPTTPLQILRDIILHVPQWPDPRYNLGVMLEGMGEIDEAAKRFRQVIHMDPAYASAWNNLGNCLLAMGDPDGARHCFEAALALTPDDPVAKYNSLHARALFGEWDEVYRLFEFRYLLPGHLVESGLPRLMPQWDGHTWVDRLIVTDEQGAGDIIQFARFLPWVEACVGRVLFRCRHPGLIPLLRYNYPAITYFTEHDPVPDADAHLPLLSTVHRLAIAERDVPWRRGYLRAPDPAPKGPRPTVGVCWAGSPSHKRDASRSMPFAAFAPLLDVPGIRFVNLTVGARAAVAHPHLEHLAFGDYADTANVVAGCDLVVTVDTSVLHLAGAMGVPTWGLIAAACDWRWGWKDTEGRIRTTSPWYASLRLVRQPRADAWPDVIAQLAFELDQWRRQRVAA